MYTPKGFHWFGPVGTVLLGFYIKQQLGASWDVHLLVQLPLTVIAAEWGAYIWQAGVVWQKFEAGWDIKPEAPKPSAVPLNVDGEARSLIYTQVTEAPRIDAERMVAKTLINQRNGNLKVDLTEGFWINDGNRFGAERDVFVAMKKRWERNGVIERAGVGKTAPHRVADWRKVRLVADGHALPLP